MLAVDNDPRLTVAENAFRKRILRVRDRINGAGARRPLTGKEQAIHREICAALRGEEEFRAYFAAQEAPAPQREAT